jgi:hypothetical protein
VPVADDKIKSGTTTSVWRPKMTKRNWVGGLNVRLDRTADWVDEKNMVVSMRLARKIREGILTDQNGKKIKTGKKFWVAEN